MTTMQPMATAQGGEDLRKHSGWFLGLGVLMIILGMIALGATVAATLASVMVLAWILIISGAAHLVEAFQTRQWKGVAWHLLLGVVDLLVGVWLLVNPAVGAVKITLILAILLVIEGVLQVIAALSGRFPNRGWQIFSGVITFVLGVMVWREWPYSATWFLGMCVGIMLIFRGWSLVGLSMLAKRMP